MRFIPDTEAGALRAHLDRELEGPVTLDLFIEPSAHQLGLGNGRSRRSSPARSLQMT